MRLRLLYLLGGLALATTQLALAQGGSMILPKLVEAGSAFSIQGNGSGKATLYIIGPGQVIDGRQLEVPADDKQNSRSNDN